MAPGTLARKISRREIILLVYGVIAIIIISDVSAATFQYVQWFDGLDSLNVNVYSVKFSGNGSSSYPLQAVINSTLLNPTDFGGLKLNTVYYTVFLNSTTEQYMFRDSSEFSLRSYTYKTTIPARGALDLSYTPQVDSEAFNSAQLFILNHPDDLTPIVGIDLVLTSSFGTLSVPFCFQMPMSQPIVCPPTRSALPSRFR